MASRTTGSAKPWLGHKRALLLVQPKQGAKRRKHVWKICALKCRSKGILDQATADAALILGANAKQATAEQELQDAQVEILNLEHQIESMRATTPAEQLRTQQRIQTMQTRISDVTSQSNAFKRDCDAKQAQINAMNLRTNDNHRKYIEVQNTARTLHGQLQTTRSELAQARRYPSSVLLRVHGVM